MLRNTFAPTDFFSRDRDPRLSPEQKLAIIAGSKPSLKFKEHEGTVRYDRFRVCLPFTYGGDFRVKLDGAFRVLYSNLIDIGDRQLYQQGIGSRILKAAIAYTALNHGSVTEFQTNPARLGLVRTVVSALGAENTGVDMNYTRYGWGGTRDLEALLRDHPPTPNAPYIVDSISARIDPNQAITWEQPVVVNDA